MEGAGPTCDGSAIPFDPARPAVTSGVRLGTSAGTARGFGEAEFRKVGDLILRVVDALATAVLGEMRDLCRRFPVYR